MIYDCALPIPSLDSIHCIYYLNDLFDYNFTLLTWPGAVQLSVKQKFQLNKTFNFMPFITE